MQIIKTLILFFVTSMGYSQTDNLIKNGGFESRTDFWKTYNSTTAIAKFSQDNNEFHSGSNSLNVQVSKLGRNPWDVNLVQPFKSRKGIIYEIKFYAKTRRKGK